jgi:hypothetical protein
MGPLTISLLFVHWYHPLGAVVYTFQRTLAPTFQQARRPKWRCGYVRCARDKAASRSTTATGR